MKKLFLFFLQLIMIQSITSFQYYSEDYFYSVDLEKDWKLLTDQRGYQALFQHKAGEAFIEILAYELNAANNTKHMYQLFTERLKMKGQSQDITFCQYPAVEGHLAFKLDGLDYKIDMVVFQDDYYFYLVLGYCIKKSYAKHQNQLARIMNTFKIYYDNGVIYSNENKTKKTEAINKKIQQLITESGTYELKMHWNNYREKFTFKKEDLFLSINELNKMMIPSYWQYFEIDYQKDSDYQFTLWKKFYQEVYDKNFYRVTPIVEWFVEQAEINRWSSYELAIQVIQSIQQIPYERPYNIVVDKNQCSNQLDYLTPNQVAWYNQGDCDTKSMFIVLVLRRLGFDAVIFFSFKYSHAMAGININGSGEYKEYKNKKFYFIESTYPGWKIGDLPPQMGDTSYWRVIPIQ
ncbi:MAG: hypothetical protein MJB14_20380 [Spirochaetes bacterium]|nr:hypothetical protein [Spirochaetota bacterium]